MYKCILLTNRILFYIFLTSIHITLNFDVSTNKKKIPQTQLKYGNKKNHNKKIKPLQKPCITTCYYTLHEIFTNDLYHYEYFTFCVSLKVIYSESCDL